ncbi:MAG: ComEC/Rec2 family competence protein [Phycisphaerae bacterium]|nr:ComEC/Rec2 family competence protein [Phycisphaerae bacterium]
MRPGDDEVDRATRTAVAPGEAHPRHRTTPSRRGVWAFAWLALGLIAGRWIGADALAPSACLGVCAAALIGAGLSRGRLCVACLAGAMAAFGAGWWGLRMGPWTGSSLGALIPATPEGPVLIELEGIVEETPRRAGVGAGALARWAHREEETLFTLRACRAASEAGWIETSGRVRIRAPGDLSGIGAGDGVRVKGFFQPVVGARNPGRWDPVLAARQEGLAGTLRVSSSAASGVLERIGPARASEAFAGRWLGGLARARVFAERALGLDQPSVEGGGASEARALMGALLLGYKDPVLADAERSFARLGLVHALSISGFHLSVMAALAMALLRLSGDRGAIEPLALAALVGAYLLVVPAEAPMVRSALMVLAFLLAEAFGRRYDRVNLLAWIGAALLLWRPLDLWSAGFQLSLGITALLLWMGGSAGERLLGARLRGTVQDERPRGVRRVLADRARDVVGVNVMCWAAAAPAVALHTGVLSTVGWLTSIVVVPVIAAALGVGFAALLLGVAAPSLAGVLTGLTDGIGTALLSMVEALDGLPWMAVRLPSIPAAWAWGATAVVVAWFRWGEPGGGTRARLVRRGAAAAVVLLAAWLGVTLGFTGTARGVALRVDTLAVGDGTCHLVRSGSSAMLWDCGSLSPGVGVREIPAAARALGAWRVPTVLVTHANFDHYAGVLDVLDPLGVERVLVTGVFMDHVRQFPSGPTARLASELTRRGVDLRVARAGDVIDLGRARGELIWPPEGWRAASPADNNASLVARFAAGEGPALLLCGDIEGPAMEGIAARRPGLPVAVMEAPHHGSYKPAARDFVSSLDPRVVLQSTGASRLDDPRWDEIRHGRTWLSTARDGALWCEIGMDGSIRTGTRPGAR